MKIALFFVGFLVLFISLLAALGGQIGTGYGFLVGTIFVCTASIILAIEDAADDLRKK
jgi:hypothetical protein